MKIRLEGNRNEQVVSGETILEVVQKAFEAGKDTYIEDFLGTPEKLTQEIYQVLQRTKNHMHQVEIAAENGADDCFSFTFSVRIPLHHFYGYPFPAHDPKDSWFWKETWGTAGRPNRRRPDQP